MTIYICCYIVLVDSLQQQTFYIGESMATKAKKSTTKKAPVAATTVTRIKATDTKKPVAKKKTSVTKKVASKKSATKKPAPRGLGWLFAIGGYFKGAWFELRQVRWPNRRATWSLTGAVLIFTAFFVVLVVLLDILFKFLFELILK